jgi:iron(III) transport system substrate-binding protein
MSMRVRLVAGVLAVLAVVAVLAWLAVPPRHDLVVYTSADDVYSRPLVEEFQKDSGLKVGLVTDAEAAKTTGLYQALLADKKNPRADVFWNNEISRTLLLARKNVLQSFRPAGRGEVSREFNDPAGRWYGFACRARVIVYNTEKVAEKDAPRSIFDLTTERWKGQVAMAYPLFGTAATHCAALRAHEKLGREKAMAFLRDLVANGLQVAPGNGAVADRVAAGQALVGITDTDDYWVRKDQGKPLGVIYPDQEPGQIGTLIIPNTASLVAGARHPEAAKKFLDFLLSARAEALLAEKPARHMPVRPNVPAAKDTLALYEIRVPMQVDWEAVATEIEAQAEALGKLFPR